VSEDLPQWSTTKTIATVKEAMMEGLAERDASEVQEAKLPLKVVVGLCVFLITQALTVAGLYHDIQSDVRSLQEAQGDLDTLAEESDLEAVRARLDGLQETLTEIEADMKSPPTSMDHMRVIGEIKADLRLLDQRLDWLEKR
jgi:hypothetical protein|tara:strand:+ start:970 stop:1395 length:426 start_codon:yes stop_codon:yes gene_type:complete